MHLLVFCVRFSLIRPIALAHYLSTNLVFYYSEV